MLEHGVKPAGQRARIHPPAASGASSADAERDGVFGGTQLSPPRRGRWEQMGTLVVHSPSWGHFCIPQRSPVASSRTGDWIFSLGEPASRRRAWYPSLLTKLKYLYPGMEKAKQPTPRAREAGVRSHHPIRKQQGKQWGLVLPFPAVLPTSAASGRQTAPLQRPSRGQLISFHSSHQTPQKYLLRRHVHLLGWSSCVRHTYKNRNFRGCGKTSGMGKGGPF